MRVTPGDGARLLDSPGRSPRVRGRTAALLDRPRLGRAPRAALPAVPAVGYHGRGVPLVRRVVCFYTSARDQSWALAQAVSSWNRSGANVRLVATARAEAQLVIRHDPAVASCRAPLSAVAAYDPTLAAGGVAKAAPAVAHDRVEEGRQAGHLDLGRPRAHELADPARRDEYRVEAGALELEHVVAACERELGDRELSRRDVGQEREHRFDRIGVVVGVRREQEDLRVETLESPLQLVLVADVDDEFELGVLAAVRLSFPDGERVRVGGQPAAAPEKRQRRRLANAFDAGVDDERLRPLRLGVGRGGRVRNVDDDRDPVAFGEVVAQTSRS